MIEVYNIVILIDSVVTPSIHWFVYCMLVIIIPYNKGVMIFIIGYCCKKQQLIHKTYLFPILGDIMYQVKGPYFKVSATKHSFI